MSRLRAVTEIFSRDAGTGSHTELHAGLTAVIVFDCWLNAKHTTVQLNLKHCRDKDIGCGCLDPMLWSLLEGRCKTICGTLTVDVNTLQDAFTIALKNPGGGTFLGDLCTFLCTFYALSTFCLHFFQHVYSLVFNMFTGFLIHFRL